MVPSLWSDRPESITDGLGVATNPVYIQDLGFWLPVAAMIGWWLWSGRSLGIVLAGGLLAFWILESVSIAVDQAFGVAADPSSRVVSTALIPGFLVLATAQAVAFVLHVRAVQPAPAEAGHRTRPNPAELVVVVGVRHAPLGAVRGRLGSALHSQLGQQGRHVILHGLLGQEEPFADLPIREAIGDQFENFSLAR